MSNPQKGDETWASLADVDEDERRKQMETRYTELAMLSEDQRQARLRAMAEVEYVLPDDKLRPFHLSRLQVWLGLDPNLARTLGASYDTVMDQMPGDIAMRRVAITQTLGRSFSLAEQEQLRELLPRVFGDRGTATSGLSTLPASAGLLTAAHHKPWWAFWRKGPTS